MTARTSLPGALEGCRIVIAVDRRASDLGAALRRHGAEVEQAPAMSILPHIDDAALLTRTRELIASPPDVLVVTTGVGFRGWMEAAHEADLADRFTNALSGTRLFARGAKAHGALQQAGLTASWVAAAETSAEIGKQLLEEGVSGLRIAVQHHGSGADGLDELLRRHGAEVTSATVYRWGPPSDRDALARTIQGSATADVDAVLFTSAPGAQAWLEEAERLDALPGILESSAAQRLLLAAVGPVTAAPLQERGIDPLIAERGRLGTLVRAVVARLSIGSLPHRDTRAGRLELRSRGAVLDGRFIPLPRSGMDVLRTLFSAGDRVVSRAELQNLLPHSPRSPHAVEMAVARVRDALAVPGVIKTVVKRGYRLDSPGE